MIAAYEPLYRPNQEKVEPAFLPLTVRNTHPEWRELRIIVDMFRCGIHRKQRLTGLFSPRFRQKAGISGEQFIAHVEAHPGADVYLVNALAHLSCFSFNVWMEGEWSHPGLTERAQALLDACGIGWRISETPRQPSDVACYSNFWIGTEEFWEDFVGGVLNPIAEYLERAPEGAVAKSVLSPTYHREAATFLPFIVERLVSTYMSHARPKVIAYPLNPADTCRYDVERDYLAFVGERVRRADQKGYFPPDLIAWMDLLCRLRARYRLALFATRVHPYTGWLVDRELIESGVAALNAVPMPTLR